MTDEQVKHLTEMLRTVIRLSDYTNRDIERRLGFSGGYLSRLFGGQVEIKVSHILNVLEIIGMYPSEFFQIAFPPAEGEPSPVMKKLLAMTPQRRPLPVPAAASTPPPAPSLSAREIEERLSEALRKVFSEIETPRRS
jgi:transcriptional regulator with XRE-family HTH domain